jgi:selenium-binding protein 1
MITSSWAHPHSIMKGMAPMDEVGDEVVAWDWKAGKVISETHLDKAPLEVRWMHGSGAKGGFVNCAFGNSVWYWEVKDGKPAFSKVIQLPDNSIPADMRLTYDNKFLFVSLFGAGAVNQYDVTNPAAPKLVSTVAVPQAQMMKLTPDNQRLYISNSLLSNLDGNVPYRVRLINVTATGMALDPKFDVDFQNFPTGAARPHDMLLK